MENNNGTKLYSPIINYLDLFSSLPNFNFNKEIVIDDFYNPTLYKWDGNWIVSWISDEGDSLLDFTSSTPEKVIFKAVKYIKENYPFYYGKHYLDIEKDNTTQELTD